MEAGRSIREDENAMGGGRSGPMEGALPAPPLVNVELWHSLAESIAFRTSTKAPRGRRGRFSLGLGRILGLRRGWSFILGVGRGVGLRLRLCLRFRSCLRFRFGSVKRKDVGPGSLEAGSHGVCVFACCRSLRVLQMAAICAKSRG